MKAAEQGNADILRVLVENRAALDYPSEVRCVCSHRVEGVDYLRADYSVECHTPEFMAMAAYAGVWLVLYVAAFPLFVLCKLWSYREAEEVRRAAEKEKKKREKEESTFSLAAV